LAPVGAIAGAGRRKLDRQAEKPVNCGIGASNRVSEAALLGNWHQQAFGAEHQRAHVQLRIVPELRHALAHRRFHLVHRQRAAQARRSGRANHPL
jgi:hypothetical protein